MNTNKAPLAPPPTPAGAHPGLTFNRERCVSCQNKSCNYFKLKCMDQDTDLQPKVKTNFTPYF